MSSRYFLATVRLIQLVILTLFWVYALAWVSRSMLESDWGLSSAGGIHPSFREAEHSTPENPHGSLIGVTVDVMDATPTQRAERLLQLSESGFTWARQRIDWARIEPRRGLYHWQPVDEILAAFTNAGLEPVIMLDNSPNWARAEQDRNSTNLMAIAPPAEPSDLAHFATAFAHRYGAQVRYYQVWDEPNIAPRWGNHHIEPVAYARMLRVVGDAIRSVDPDAFILAAALAPTVDRGHTAIDEGYFLNRLYASAHNHPLSRADRQQFTSSHKRAAAPLFDAVAIQPFGFEYTPNHPRRHYGTLNFQRVAFIRRAMVAAGDSHTPIWAMRFGWSRHKSTTLDVARPDVSTPYSYQNRNGSFKPEGGDHLVGAACSYTDLWPPCSYKQHLRHLKNYGCQIDFSIGVSKKDVSQRNKTSWPLVSAAMQVEFATQAIKIADSSWPWLTHMGWPVDNVSHVNDPLSGFTLTGPLAAALLQPQSNATSTTDIKNSASPFRATWVVQLIGLLAAAIMLGWRGRAAIGLLPRNRWVATCRGWPRWVHMGLLITIIAIYYFAVWPPLIVFCYGAAALLFWAKPRHGLILAILLLPFHFQHKEIRVVDWVLNIGPAHAVLVCLLPALLSSKLILRRDFVISRRNNEKSLRVEPEISRSVPPLEMTESGRSLVVVLRSAGFVALRRIWNRLMERFREGRQNRGGSPHLLYSSLNEKYHLNEYRSLDGLAVAWLFLGFLSFVNVWYRPAYVEGLIDLVFMPLLLYLCVRVWGQQGVGSSIRGYLCTAFVVSGLLTAIVGLWQWSQGIGVVADGVRRLVGPHFSPNHTALYLDRTFFVGLGMVLWAANKPRSAANRALLFGLLIVAGATGIALLLTASRGAWLLGIPAGLMVFGGARLIQTKSWLSLWPRWRGMVLISGLVAGLIVLMPMVMERLANSATIMRRLHIWQASFHLWQDFPLLGVGPGGYFWRYPAYILDNLLLDPNLRHPHNLWLEHGTMMGAPGLVWLFVLIGWLAVRLYQNTQLHHHENDVAQTQNAGGADWISVGLTASLVASLAHSQVDAFGALTDLAMANWLILGIMSHRRP